MVAKFELGKVSTTAKVFEEINKDEHFHEFVHASLCMHSMGQWGHMDKEDIMVGLFSCVSFVILSSLLLSIAFNWFISIHSPNFITSGKLQSSISWSVRFSPEIIPFRNLYNPKISSLSR